MPIRAQAIGGRVFPAPAPDRPRARRRRSGCERGDRGRADGQVAFACRWWPAMRSLSRRRDAPYRVYGEDEFLSSGGSMTESPPTGPAREEQRARRFAGLALLAGALGAVGGVIVAHGPSSAKDVVRKARGRSEELGRSQLAIKAVSTGVQAPVRRTDASGRRAPRPRRSPISRRPIRGRATEHADFASVHPGRREAHPRTLARSSAARAARLAPARRTEFGFER